MSTRNTSTATNERKERGDGITTTRSGRYTTRTDPDGMSGTVELPVALVLNTNLSFGARVVYATLAALAHESGVPTGDEVTVEVSMVALADAVGCSETALRKFLGELRPAGWIATKRATKNRLPRHTFHSRPTAKIESANSDKTLSAKSGLLAGRNDGSSRARSMPLNLELESSYEDSIVGVIPKLTKTDGRDLAFDMLAKVCRIAATSPRNKSIPIALNGSANTGPGIREQLWIELVNYRDAETGEGLDLDVCARDFETMLARTIEQRSRAYEIAMPGATLTPTALAKWWSDLPAMVKNRGGGDLATRMIQHATKLREEGR